MEILSHLLPQDRNNPIHYCILQAQQCTKDPSWSNIQVNIFAARFFAAMTPLACLYYGTDAIKRGLTHYTLTWIKPEWATEPINSFEEIKSGVKAYILVVITVAYAALSILFGASIINQLQVSSFECAHESNTKICERLSKDPSHFHLTHHQGKLIVRRVLSHILEEETIEILRETFELAKARARFHMTAPDALNNFRSVIKTICKTSSTSELSSWNELKGEAESLQDLSEADLKIAVSRLIPSLDTVEETFIHITESELCAPIHVFDKHLIITFLNRIYSRETVQQVVEFYSPEDNLIPTRLFHAIIVGIQANLTARDVVPTTLEKLDEMRQTLPTQPRYYYTDQYFVQLQKDLFFLENLARVEDYDPIFITDPELQKRKHFQFSEFLARFVSYSIFGTKDTNWRLDISDTRELQSVEGTLFACYHNDVKKLMRIDKIYICGGLKMMEVRSLCGRFGATLFRGTGDWNSLRRNFEVRGVGRSSFAQLQIKLLAQFKQTSKPKEWHIIGHSLGGCDAQRYMHMLFTNFTWEALPKRLRLWTFNSPMIEEPLNIEFLKKATGHPDLTISHALVKGDRIQEFGQVHLGMDKEETLKATYDYAYLSPLSTARERHTTPSYTSKQKSTSYESKSTLDPGKRPYSIVSGLLRNGALPPGLWEDVRQTAKNIQIALYALVPTL